MSEWLRRFRTFLLLPVLGMAAWPAELALAEDVVDVQLVLAVDVSLSMSPSELIIQRDGYAAALTDEAVVAAIRSGAYGRIAVAYVEWAGNSTQQVVVPWTVIEDLSSAKAFVAKMTAMPPRSARRTSIAAALDFSRLLFDAAEVRGLKRVIDVSGDGPNNQGDPVMEARARVLEQGIVINGLPLMTNGGGMTTPYDIANLDNYYRDCVIGGPGAFMIPVNDWSQFPEAVRRKLVMELAGSDHFLPPADREAPPLIRVSNAPPSDCLIGEKMWNNRNWMDLQ